MNKESPSSLIVWFGLLALLIPQNLFAAELIFKVVPNSAASDKTTTIEVRIDPQSRVLNAVEGTIKLQAANSGDLSVDVLTDGSVLTIWPTPPRYISNEKSISFTGGVPGGFNDESLLFRMRLSSSPSDHIVISWIGGSAYLNDGKGTKEAIYAKPLTIGVDEQSQDTISQPSSDNTITNNAIIPLLFVGALIIIFVCAYAYKKLLKK